MINSQIIRSQGIRSKSPDPKLPFEKSPFAKSLMVKRVLFIGNQLGLLSVYKSVESDKKSFRLVTMVHTAIRCDII